MGEEALDALIASIKGMGATETHYILPTEIPDTETLIFSIDKNYPNALKYISGPQRWGDDLSRISEGTIPQIEIHHVGDLVDGAFTYGDHILVQQSFNTGEFEDSFKDELLTFVDQTDGEKYMYSGGGIVSSIYLYMFDAVPDPSSGIAYKNRFDKR